MAKFGCAAIGLFVLMTGAVSTHAADLSVTPIYKARSSDERTNTWRIMTLGKTFTAAEKSQDKAQSAVAEDALSSAIVAGIYAWPKAPDAGTAK